MRDNAQDKRLLHVKEAAHELDVHPSTVRRLIADGELAAIRVGRHGRLRVRREALDDLLVPVAPNPKEEH